MAELTCVLVTPEETALDEKAEFVALPLYDGEVGIAPNHSPMIGRLGFGEMRIRAAGKETRYYVDGGFVQVADNVVSVLTNRALTADQIDVSVAQQQLDDANQRRTTSDDEHELRQRTIAQARAQLQVAKRGQ